MIQLQILVRSVLAKGSDTQVSIQYADALNALTIDIPLPWLLCLFIWS